MNAIERFQILRARVHKLSKEIPLDAWINADSSNPYHVPSATATNLSASTDVISVGSLALSKRRSPPWTS